MTKRHPVDKKQLTKLFYDYAQVCRDTWPDGVSPHTPGRPNANQQIHHYPWPNKELQGLIDTMIISLSTKARYRNDPDIEDMQQTARIFINRKSHAFKRPENAHSYITAIILSAFAEFRRSRYRAWHHVDFVDEYPADK